MLLPNTFFVLFCILTFVSSSSIVSVTKLLESNVDSAVIKEKTRVKIGDKDFGYSGHFTTNRGMEIENHIFFWFQPCRNCTMEKSELLVWLQGGPGGAGTFGAMTEIGNWYVQNGTAKERCFSWCEQYSCLFVDQPVESGFSYQTDSDGNPIVDMKRLNLTDTSPDAMRQIHSVISQFLDVFSELRPVPLIITGESYGGLYTPNLGVLLAGDPDINLRGLAVGDPCIDWSVQMPTYADSLYGLGVLNLDQKDKISKIMDSSVSAIEAYERGEGTCRSSFDFWNSVWDDDGHDTGGETSGLFTLFTGSTMTEDILMSASPSSFGEYNDWFARPDVAKAFHIDGIENMKPKDETLGLVVYDAFVESGDWCIPSAPLYAQLIDQDDINLMIYTSTVDPLLGPPQTEAGVNRILSLTSSSRRGNTNRTLWMPGKDDSVSGYAECSDSDSGNTRFCYVVVRNAGHMTPAFMPRASLDMFNRFISGHSFEGPDSKELESILPTCLPCGGAGPFGGTNVVGCD